MYCDTHRVTSFSVEEEIVKSNFAINSLGTSQEGNGDLHTRKTADDPFKDKRASRVVLGSELVFRN